MEISSDYCIYSQIWNIPWVIKLNTKQIIYHMLSSIYSPSISLISLTCLQCFEASRLFLWSMVVSHLIAYRYNISPSMALPSERLTTWLIDNTAHSLNFIQSRTGPDPYNSTSSHLCQNKSASSIYSWLQTLSLTSCSLLFYLKPSLQLHRIICEDVWLDCTDSVLSPLPHLQVTNPTPSSFCMLHFSLLTKNVPQLDKFPINFYPCLHLMRKLEECILLTQKVNGHETPRGGKTTSSFRVDLLLTW